MNVPDTRQVCVHLKLHIMERRNGRTLADLSRASAGPQPGRIKNTLGPGATPNQRAPLRIIMQNVQAI